jgi:dihydroorotate dehydrogenase
VPLLVKIAPDLNDMQIEALARVFNEQNIDGVIATNTTIDREAITGHRWRRKPADSAAHLCANAPTSFSRPSACC